MFSSDGRKKQRQPIPRGGWFWRCMALFLLLTGLLVLVVLIGASMIGLIPMLNLVQHTMNVARPWLHSAQLATIALFWLRWNEFVAWLERRGRIPPRMRSPLLAARHRIMGWILAFQILVVMGIPFQNPFLLH